MNPQQASLNLFRTYASVLEDPAAEPAYVRGAVAILQYLEGRGGIVGTMAARMLAEKHDIIPSLFVETGHGEPVADHGLFPQQVATGETQNSLNIKHRRVAIKHAAAVAAHLYRNKSGKDIDYAAMLGGTKEVIRFLLKFNIRFLPGVAGNEPDVSAYARRKAADVMFDALVQRGIGIKPGEARFFWEAIHERMLSEGYHCSRQAPTRVKAAV